jgi:hypothetical protein
VSPSAKPKSGAADVRRIALSLPETAEAPHFESASFRVRGKIFATVGEKPGRAVVKLPPPLQAALSADHPDLFASVGGHWGRSGWTYATLDAIDRALLRDVLVSAWACVAPKKLLAAHASRLRKP